jgi:hypothetical protein
MKTERRHELETNELARRATVWIEKVKPYSPQIVSVVVVLLVIWVFSSVWGSFSSSQNEAAWDAYSLALNSRDLEMQNMRRLADDPTYAGTAVQEWALAAWADRQLALATREYFIDRDAAIKRMQNTVGTYETLATSAGDEQIRNRARFGLGRINEIQDNLDQAREQYDQVQGDLQPLARTYADRTLSPEVIEVYAWLSTAELPRHDLSGGPGTPGSKPFFDAEPPDASDSTGINLKTLEDILGISSDAPAEDRYGTEPAPADGSADDEAAEDRADEAEDMTTDAVDDIFGDEEAAEEPASEDAPQP